MLTPVCSDKGMQEMQQLVMSADGDGRMELKVSILIHIMSEASVIHEGAEIHKVTITQARKTQIRPLGPHKCTANSPGRRATSIKKNLPDVVQLEMRKSVIEAMKRFVKPADWDELVRYPNKVMRAHITELLGKDKLNKIGDVIWPIIYSGRTLKA